MGFFEKLKDGLAKTRKGIAEKIDQALLVFGRIDEELLGELEEILIASDVGIDATERIISNIKARIRERKIVEPSAVKTLLMDELLNILKNGNPRLKLETLPSVILAIGVNGAGKTTSVAKIANLLKTEGKRAIVAAADTFRAAAADQLEIWTKRIGVEIIRHSEGSDPAAVVFDAIQAVKARKADVLICDTAGRLHTKKNLMEELKKILRVIERELPDADIETLLVLDATTGQNAISQARTFGEAIKVSGIVLTKLDGTAKGGIIVAIESELGIPVKLIGVGEKIGDMQAFNAKEFIEALFEG